MVIYSGERDRGRGRKGQKGTDINREKDREREGEIMREAREERTYIYLERALLSILTRRV